MTVERDYLVRWAGECDAFSGIDTILVEVCTVDSLITDRHLSDTP